jgi:heat-inducible transcriptional repressor
MSLSIRGQLIFKQLMEVYLQRGQPVGSKTLAQRLAGRWSAATIRKELVDLEEAGYIIAPHVSAGRAPTVQGLRFFVENLLTMAPLTQEKIEAITLQFDPYQPLEAVLYEACQLLSQMTQLVGWVTLPAQNPLILQQIELIRVGKAHILAILIANQHQIQQRLIASPQYYSADALQQASHYLTQQCKNQSLTEVYQAVMQLPKPNSLQGVLSLVEVVLEKLVEKPEEPASCWISGEQHFFRDPKTTQSASFPLLLEAVFCKQPLLGLLAQTSNEGIQMQFGEESGISAFNEATVISAPYTIGGQFGGKLGIVGPLCMRYEQVIPLVDLTAKLLGAALN